MSGEVTYRQSVVAVYTHPLTIMSLLAGFTAWAKCGWFAGFAVTALIGGYAAMQVIEELLE